jgi:hypothetical protein
MVQKAVSAYGRWRCGGVRGHAGGMHGVQKRKSRAGRVLDMRKAQLTPFQSLVCEGGRTPRHDGLGRKKVCI